jgi:hypothetical protein
MDMRNILTGLAVAAALAGAACNNGSSTPVVAPSATTTDTFSATVPLGGTMSHTFTTVTSGEIDVVLTADATTAGANIPLLVGLGTVNADGSCAVSSSAVAILQLVSAPALPAVTTQAAGPYCLGVVDYYSLGPVTYTITVTHH